ncbi:EPIDERMAL PATTERNING FACTOR-like protein 2 [Benincasa hispida]|uniref:EPIDERMAL PATTERNING FACTOR-like protein 2 n=1 Tax=Benincasa hispida TaxID=102211 RepID=UPI00190161E9|nr:EPIDERMAL PATTERNING FACTOR-like protein 2 [Benincasa hispida]
MGSFQNWHRIKHVSISLLFLSVSILIHVTSIVEGRGIQGSLTTGRSESPETAAAEEKAGMMMRNQIGSRPPSCRRRCRECGGHCEAVQVPVALHDLSHQNQRKKRTSRSSHFSVNSKHDVALSSEDETSNYKPISWKCKCGNFIFNP